MSNFESVFEDLDVKVADINGALESVTGSSINQDEVTQLLQQMQAEQGLEVGGAMVGAKQGQVKIAGSAQQDQEIGDMQRKLDALKNI